MGRAPCCSKVGLMRGPWSAKEDALLTEYIEHHGEGQWRSLPKKAGLLRCGKSCRLRWMNYLRPGIVRGNITEDEEDLIVRLHGLLGNRWSLIAGRFPGRTDNEIKNYWNTCLLKKLQNSGIITNSNNPNNLPKPAKNSKAIPNNKPEKDPKKKSKVPSRTDEDVIMARNGSNSEGKAKGGEDDNINRVKVYLPKPVRLCSALPRRGSVDSLASGGSSSSSNAGAGVSVQPPVFALGDVGDYYGGLCDGDGDDFLMPLLRGSVSGEDLDMVYDEYLQLLQNM